MLSIAGIRRTDSRSSRMCWAAEPLSRYRVGYDVSAAVGDVVDNNPIDVPQCTTSIDGSDFVPVRGLLALGRS